MTDYTYQISKKPTVSPFVESVLDDESASTVRESIGAVSLVEDPEGSGLYRID